MAYFLNKKVLVTGGASFIGSHLVDALVARGAKVRVADDLSSGKLENVQEHIKNKKVEFHHVSLDRTEVIEKEVENILSENYKSERHLLKGKKEALERFKNNPYKIKT